MRPRRRIGAPALAACLAFALSGCLISDKALLDEQTARATPIAAGDYSACEYDSANGEPDCETLAVARDESGLYSMTPMGESDNQTTYARYRRIGAGSWAAQLWGDPKEGYFYFLAQTKGEEFIMAMIQCGDLPKDLRDKYAARGEMEVDEQATTCSVKSLRAMTAAAKAFRDSAPISTRARIVYKRLAAVE